MAGLAFPDKRCRWDVGYDVSFFFLSPDLPVTTFSVIFFSPSPRMKSSNLRCPSQPPISLGQRKTQRQPPHRRIQPVRGVAPNACYSWRRGEDRRTDRTQQTCVASSTLVLGFSSFGGKMAVCSGESVGVEVGGLQVRPKPFFFSSPIPATAFQLARERRDAPTLRKEQQAGYAPRA